MSTLAAYAAVIAIVLTVLWTLQRRLIYFPAAVVPTPAEIGLTGVEPVVFPTADGLVLSGWFLGVGGPTPPPTVLVFNGNAGNRAYRGALAAALRQRGLQVLLFDYRGYGGNPGSPSERGLALDGRAARAYVVGRPDVDRARLVYFGESLGTAVATDLAAEHPPAALILRSPFTSLVDVGRHHYPYLPVNLLLRDRYVAIARLSRIRAPLLVIAGAQDRIVPVALSRRLYEAAPEPKTLLVLPQADHNDVELNAGQDMLAAIVRFLGGI